MIDEHHCVLVNNNELIRVNFHDTAAGEPMEIRYIHAATDHSNSRSPLQSLRVLSSSSSGTEHKLRVVTTDSSGKLQLWKMDSDVNNVGADDSDESKSKTRKMECSVSQRYHSSTAQGGDSPSPVVTAALLSDSATAAGSQEKSSPCGWFDVVALCKHVTDDPYHREMIMNFYHQLL